MVLLSSKSGSDDRALFFVNLKAKFQQFIDNGKGRAALSLQ